jgi:two-component system, sensor histidine kinase and response regulator
LFVLACEIYGPRTECAIRECGQNIPVDAITFYISPSRIRLLTDQKQWGVLFMAQLFRTCLDHRQRYMNALFSRLGWRRANHARCNESRLALLGHAMDQVAESALVIDQDARILYANRGAGVMLGYSLEKLSRMTLAHLRDSHDAGRWAEHWQSLKQRGSMVYETLAIGGNGGKIPLEINATYFEVDGRGYGLELGRDISARQQLDAMRETALREAERLAGAKNAFLANMSHEIRTPLNAVLSMAQLGMRMNRGSKAREQFSTILDAGQLLLGLLDDMLDFSKIDAGKLGLEMSQVDPHQLIDRVVDLSAARAWAKGLGFRVEEAPDLPAAFPGDPLRLSQILVNLLSNAIKFTDHGHVALKIQRSPASLLFTVSDSGIGMSEEQIARLFQPFEQADGTTTRRFGGTGLGLAISKRLADMMGGRLGASGQLGQGMVFTLELPIPADLPRVHPEIAGRIWLAGTGCAVELAEELTQWGLEVSLATPREALTGAGSPVLLPYAALVKPTFMELVWKALEQARRLAVVMPPGGANGIPDGLAQQIDALNWPPRARHILRLLRPEHSIRSMQPESSGPRLTGLRILTAEDNELNRVILAELLTLEGASVQSVENGLRLLESFKQSPAGYDIILADVQMPQMDGYQASRSIRELAPRIPIIGLTAHVLEDERQRCLESGMSAHIGKPADIDELVRLILELHAQQRYPRSAPPVAPAAAARRTQPDVEAVVDWPALDDAFLGNRELVRLGCRLLLDSQRDAPGRLRDLAANGSQVELVELVHTLKGMAGNLRAMRVWREAARFEPLARQNTKDAAQGVALLAREMECLLAEVEARMEGDATGGTGRTGGP